MAKEAKKTIHNLGIGDLAIINGKDDITTLSTYGASPCFILTVIDSKMYDSYRSLQ